MSSTTRLTRACLLVGFTILPLRVLADPIVITSGHVTSEGKSSAAAFEITGEGLVAAGRTAGMVYIGPSLCAGCAAGERIALDARIFDVFEQARITLDGTPLSGVELAGAFHITAPSMVAPQEDAPFTVSRPFGFSGTLFGYSASDPTQLLFERTLTGRGTLHAAFDLSARHLDDPVLFDFRSIRYDFEPTAPIPEPATLLLVGSGIAGMAYRCRKRRRPAAVQNAATSSP